MVRVVKDGRVIEAVELDIIGPATKSIEFPMSDGSKFIVSFTITRAWRAKSVFNNVGEPIYGADSTLTHRVRDIPSEYYGKPSPVKVEPGKPGPEVA